ncbi:conserved Plasmodium protein, unknown function [Plasmodium ovale]|uniref:Asparagine-rich protein n=1 Tax=Plasmodium ovale TaxID=36330 RepID=A0A1D3TLD0_PLAOA|nr:conserved Plasmodium protein, unknown function [Plasmodium ovale]
MASSQIRQFATLIDQLPCEADDFDLMENFEGYGQCFESSVHNNNLKGPGSFFPFNSNISDYINNISNSELSVKDSNINNRKTTNSSINENENSILENTANSENKSTEEKTLSNNNTDDLIKCESNSYTNNDPLINNKNVFFDENDINKNKMDCNNENSSNLAFANVNDIIKDDTSNYIETFNSEIEGANYAYGISKINALYKNNLCEIINHNNEYLADINAANISSKNGARNGSKNSAKNGAKNSSKNSAKNGPKNSSKNSAKNGPKNSSKNSAKNSVKNSAKNGGKGCSKNGGKNTEEVSLYNLDNALNDKPCEGNGENIVYRYNINVHPSNSENYSGQKGVDLFVTSSYTKKDEELNEDKPFHSIKNVAHSGETDEEKKEKILHVDENKKYNEEDDDQGNKKFSNYDMNKSKNKINKNGNVKNPISENSTVIDYKEFYDMLKRNDEFSKNILLSKKAKVIKLDSNKSLIIFPVNIHEYGDKYIAVNQKDLLEYISSSIEMDNEDLPSLKIKNYQKEKELQNMKAAYSMQTTNIHYLINRVIFKECEYENLKNKSLTLEQEINKLIQEVNSLLSQNKEGLYMQKAFIDYKCKCVLKLQELQPLLGDYYFDIFNYITSCRTLGQLSIWIPAFEIKNDSLDIIANNLIKILINGLGAPINSSPQYFLSNKKFFKKSISIESEEDTFINSLAKRKIIDNYLVNNLNSFNTTKENNSHFSNCHSLSLNSESSSFFGTEELFFNSSKFPSMHSVILKNNKDKKKKEKLFNKLNRSNTTPEVFCINNESYSNSDTCSHKNNQDIFISTVQSETKNHSATLIKEKLNSLKRKHCVMNNDKEIKKIRFSDDTSTNLCTNRDYAKGNLMDASEASNGEGDNGEGGNGEGGNGACDNVKFDNGECDNGECGKGKGDIDEEDNEEYHEGKKDVVDNIGESDCDESECVESDCSESDEANQGEVKNKFSEAEEARESRRDINAAEICRHNDALLRKQMETIMYTEMSNRIVGYEQRNERRINAQEPEFYSKIEEDSCVEAVESYSLVAEGKGEAAMTAVVVTGTHEGGVDIVRDKKDHSWERNAKEYTGEVIEVDSIDGEAAENVCTEEDNVREIPENKSIVGDEYNREQIAMHNFGDNESEKYETDKESNEGDIGKNGKKEIEQFKNTEVEKNDDEMFTSEVKLPKEKQKQNENSKDIKSLIKNNKKYSDLNKQKRFRKDVGNKMEEKSEDKKKKKHIKVSNSPK